MIWQIDFIILALVIMIGVAAISVKDLLAAAALFGAYSFMMCLLWAVMGAVDVAFTEASVGAVWHIAQSDVAAGRSRSLPTVAPLLSYIVLAPIIGSQTACLAIQKELCCDPVPS